jgi:hypothetical protein
MHDFDFERRQEILRRMQNLDDEMPTWWELLLAVVGLASVFFIAGWLL